MNVCVCRRMGKWLSELKDVLSHYWLETGGTKRVYLLEDVSRIAILQKRQLLAYFSSQCEGW